MIIESEEVVFSVREDINRINASPCLKFLGYEYKAKQKRRVFELENNTRASSDKAQNKWKNTQEGNRFYSVLCSHLNQIICLAESII